MGFDQSRKYLFSRSSSQQTYTGNTNSEGVVQHKLVHSIAARFLRFIPLDWSTTGWIGLRVEVYGCVYSEWVITSGCL